MEQNYKIKNGEITFDEKKIVISDNARRQLRMLLFSSSIWIFYGTMSVLRYFKTSDPFLIWTGLMIGIAHFVILIQILRRTSKSHIQNSEVHLMAIKHRFGNTFLDIKLRNSKLRRVNLVSKVPEEIKSIMATFNQT